MSIKAQIERITNERERLKEKLIAKGVTVNEDAKLNECIDLVDEIKTEGTPTGQLEITANGNYNVSNYAKANVNVPIPNGYIKPSGSLQITKNGAFDVTEKESAVVNVQPKLEQKTATPTESQQEITPSSSYDGLSKVIVNAIPSEYIVPSGTKSITTNGTNDVASYASVYVNVQPKLQEKKVTQNGEVVPDSGYDGLRKVTVNVASSGGITLKKIIDSRKNAKYLFDSSTDNDLIQSLQYNDTENASNFDHTFHNCKKTTAFPLINTSQGTDFTAIYASSAATSYPPLNTSNGTNFDSMYSYCDKATSFPLLDTSNGNNFKKMYYMCTKATIIPPLNTNNGINFTEMFAYCKLVEKIDITCFKISYSTSSNYWCSNCCSLKALIIRSFGTNYSLSTNAFENCHHILGTIDSTYNPNGYKDGYIYVPRNMTASLKSATNWSKYADQIRALEDYTVDGTTTGDLDMDKVNPPGYNVNLDPDAYVTSGKIYYSFDNGSVWLDLYPIKDRENPILTGVTQIKFKAKNTMLYCEELGMALEPMMGEEESENYTLSQDITLSTM